MTPNRGIYLYAIVPADATMPAMPGIRDEPIQILYGSGLGVLIGEVSAEHFAAVNDASADPALLGELARRHDAVVRAAADLAGAALPLRLGTVVTERQAVSDLLAVRGDQLRRLLDKVASCDEFGVRVTGGTGATASGRDIADSPSASPEPRSTPADGGDTDHGERPSGSTGAGLAYLQQRREALQRAQRHRQALAALAAGVDAALSEQAVDAVSGRGGNLLDRTYLVRRDRWSAFIEVVDECGDRLATEGYTLSLNGPWPPYSFSVTNLELAARG